MFSTQRPIELQLLFIHGGDFLYRKKKKKGDWKKGSRNVMLLQLEMQLNRAVLCTRALGYSCNTTKNRRREGTSKVSFFSHSRRGFPFTSSHRGDAQSLISVGRKASVMVRCSYCDTAPLSQTLRRCEYCCVLLRRHGDRSNICKARL